MKGSAQGLSARGADGGEMDGGGIEGGDASGLARRVLEQVRRARAGARLLAGASGEQKNEALRQMGAVLLEQEDRILEANASDVERAKAAGQPDSRLDRLRLDKRRMADMAEGIAAVSSLPDPVGEVLERIRLANGLRIEKVRVPLGVLAVVYESRPNVTADAAALAVKSGNAAVLRGGSDALSSNLALASALREGVRRSGLDPEAVQLVGEADHASVDVLIQARGLVDLVIPRGGAGLISRVVERARVPVIETGVGNCHVYVDRDADLAKATAILLNAKVQRPSVCNAAETLLVHRDLEGTWLPAALEALVRSGVELRGCPRAAAAAKRSGLPVREATEEDFAREFLALILAVRVVDSLDEAVEHIGLYGTRHSEAIVTEDTEAAESFLRRVDAAAVYHNASTRFTDGHEFGFGAEIGISTQKVHARGPMGLRELTSYKFVARGDGQVRGG